MIVKLSRIKTVLLFLSLVVSCAKEQNGVGPIAGEQIMNGPTLISTKEFLNRSVVESDKKPALKSTVSLGELNAGLLNLYESMTVQAVESRDVSYYALKGDVEVFFPGGETLRIPEGSFLLLPAGNEYSLSPVDRKIGAKLIVHRVR